MGTLRNEYVRCGKKNCRKCPHGPYWYVYYNDHVGQKKWRSRKLYLGKVDPRGDKPDDPDEAIWDDTSDNVRLAYHLVGAHPGMTRQEAVSAYVNKKMRIDPTRPGAEATFLRLEHAWAIVRRVNGWK